MGHLENVEVVASHDELVVDVAKRLGATCLVRGLRNASDLQYEASFDYYNHQLSSDIETIYLHSRPEHLYISSSGVRELLKFGQDIACYVPESILEEIRNEKKIRWPLYVIAALIVTFLAFVVPLPYYIEVPGGSEDIRQVLKINDTEDKEAGAYQFVTVGVQHATLAHMIYAWLTPFTDIRSAQETTGGSSDVEFMRINQFYMQTSQNMAKYQGLKTAGKDIELKYFGVYVLNVTDNSTFKGILNISDTVTAVNDQTFDSSKDLIDYVSSQKLGDSVKVTYEEDGQTKSAEGKIITLENGKNGIGIGLIDRTEVISNVPISFSTAGIGGPSAGLMFSLAIYTQIAHPDLRNGRIVAGTGTIDRDGNVGDIGGIDKKVVASARAGAAIFFAPDNPVSEEEQKAHPDAKNNYQTALEAAKTIKTDMKIVPVKTLQDAIDYLKNNP
ncbi:putative pantetheine-phosphate adenylyltransferase [Streptococcus pneumoniae GA16531]|nr:putative pantetheine-phosphate adenylyltransferase [Streptococcus pneumoniae GA16531]